MLRSHRHRTRPRHAPAILDVQKFMRVQIYCEIWLIKAVTCSANNFVSRNLLVDSRNFMLSFCQSFTLGFVETDFKWAT